MTIYDSDYVAEEELQNNYNTGVTDSAAENQEAIPVAEAQEQAVDQSEQQLEMTEEAPQEQVSDKEMNFRAMREEIAKIKAEKEALAENFDAWKRELATNNVRREPEAPRKSLEESLPDDDLVTGAQLKKMLAERDAQHKKVLEEQELLNQEYRMKQQYQDYDEVASKYGVPLLKQEPELQQAFIASKNKPAFLYKLGKMQQVIDAPAPDPVIAPPKQVNKAQRMLENSRKPGTLSGATQGQQGISQAEYFQNMSQQDFEALVKKNLEQV